MLYLKQFLINKWTPHSVDFILTEIPNDSRALTVIANRNIYKKCKYGFKQYLFVYRLILLKLIETLDCILKDNQEPFIEPYKNIHFYYPFLLFMYMDIGLMRKRFFLQQGLNNADFEEIPNLAGDPNTMVKMWNENRSRYLNYKGEIEAQFATNGFTEFHIPIRLKIIFEQIDEILDFQKKQYSPIIVNNIRLIKNALVYKNQKVIFKVDGKRLKLVKLLIKNKTGIKYSDVKQIFDKKYHLFKSNIQQINNRINKIDLTIKHDKFKKIYLLTTLK